MVIISVRVRLNLDISVTMSVSHGFNWLITLPNFRSFWFFFPLTISVTHRLTSISLVWAKRLISSCWLTRCCLLVLTLKYAITIVYHLKLNKHRGLKVFLLSKKNTKRRANGFSFCFYWELESIILLIIYFFWLVGISRCLGHSIIGRDLWLIVGVAF